MFQNPFGPLPKSRGSIKHDSQSYEARINEIEADPKFSANPALMRERSELYRALYPEEGETAEPQRTVADANRAFFQARIDRIEGHVDFRKLPELVKERHDLYELLYPDQEEE